jgi:hypothetical protein
VVNGKRVISKAQGKAMGEFFVSDKPLATRERPRFPKNSATLEQSVAYRVGGCARIWKERNDGTNV